MNQFRHVAKKVLFTANELGVHFYRQKGPPVGFEPTVSRSTASYANQTAPLHRQVYDCTTAATDLDGVQTPVFRLWR